MLAAADGAQVQITENASVVITPGTGAVVVSAGSPGIRTTDLTEGPIWRMAEAALQGINRPATVPEIARGIVNLGGRAFLGRARENLRAMIRGKKDVFENIGEGYFALRAWPDSKKRHREHLFVRGE